MSGIQITPDAIKKLKEIRSSKNIITYLICVIVASMLWLLNALNKEYSVGVTYPVKYVHFPDRKYPALPLPEQLRVEVKANGFTLLRYRIHSSFLPITFDISSYSGYLQQDSDSSEFTIHTEELKDKIKSLLSPNIKLQNVSPEQITFKFAVAGHKKVAVKPVLDYTLKRQYIVTSVKANPDSLWVTGPSSIIDTLQFIPTKYLFLKELSKKINRELELVPPAGCMITEHSAEVFLNVEHFTEAKRTLPITALHVPDSMNIRLFPPNIDISYEIGLSQYEKIRDDDFIFSVEYPKDAENNFLEVQVIKVPDFIKNLSFSPQKVEYILERK